MAQGAIIQANDVHKGITTYRMKDGRKNLPKYKHVVIDGTHVRLILEDGGVHHLPPCFKGYVLKTAFPHEITLVKPDNNKQ